MFEVKLCCNEVIYIRIIGKQLFGSQDMTVLNRNLCYSEGCYNEVDLYFIFRMLGRTEEVAVSFACFFNV